MLKCTIDFAGNFLTVRGMWSERTTSSTPYLLIHLAVADVILLLTFWFFQFCQTMFNVYGAWKSWERVFAYPRSMSSLVTTFAHISGWLLNLFILWMLCPPRSSGKVMFLVVFVSQSVHKGCPSVQGPGSVAPPPPRRAPILSCTGPCPSKICSKLSNLDLTVQDCAAPRHVQTC